MYLQGFRLTTGRYLAFANNTLFQRVVTDTIYLPIKGNVRKWQLLKAQTRNFHATQKLCYPTSLVLCCGSILCGIYVRRWWWKLTPIQQEAYIRWYNGKKRLFHGYLGLLSILFIVYCLLHLERDPIEQVPRLVLFDNAKRIENAKLFFRIVVQSKDNVVPLSHPMYSNVAAAVRKLGNCNQEIFKDTDWTITIINRMFNIASVPNVLILPDKNIVIVADIFNFIKSRDQLMFILAHEMSHEMLLHTSESLSLGLLFDSVTILGTFVIWTLFGGGVAALLCSCMYIIISVIFSWYKRGTEAEADAVGLKLAAKSCVDLREVVVFWEIMKMFEELTGQKLLQVPLLTNHPTLENRQKKTIKMLPKGLELREKANCPPLPDKDPRDLLPMYKKDIENHLNKRPRFLGMSL